MSGFIIDADRSISAYDDSAHRVGPKHGHLPDVSRMISRLRMQWSSDETRGWKNRQCPAMRGRVSDLVTRPLSSKNGTGRHSTRHSLYTPATDRHLTKPHNNTASEPTTSLTLQSSKKKKRTKNDKDDSDERGAKKLAEPAAVPYARLATKNPRPVGRGFIPRVFEHGTPPVPPAGQAREPSVAHHAY